MESNSQEEDEDDANDLLAAMYRARAPIQHEPSHEKEMYKINSKAKIPSTRSSKVKKESSSFITDVEVKKVKNVGQTK